MHTVIANRPALLHILVQLLNALYSGHIIPILWSSAVLKPEALV
jgi:hypothetical protein